jgi:membrane spanning protein
MFGSNNSLTWVGIIVGIMLYWNLDIGINKKEAPIVILALFIFTGIANRIAEINPVLGIFVNLISIFLIMCIPSEKPEYKAYIPFILIYIFDQSNIAVGEDFYTRMVSLIVGGIITGVVYYFRHKNLEEGIHISKIMKDIDITSPRFIISIRMAIGVSIAILIGTLLGLQRTMWISMSVMSLTQLEFETTKERFKHRIVYTLIGAVAFVLLFQVLIPEKYNGLASIILSYIYTFIKDYKHQIIFITVNALSASMLIFDPTEAIGTRILLIISGCMLAMVINKIDLKKPMIAIKERLAKPDIA